MIQIPPAFTPYLNCECGLFSSSPDHFFQCLNCNSIIPFFKDIDELEELPKWETSSAKNPVNPKLVWGTHQQINRAFLKRVSIAQDLIRNLSCKRYIGADVSGGAGRWLPHLAFFFNQYLHMDISREALKVACVTGKENKNVIYIQNDLLATRLMVKNVEVAICLDTLLYGGDFVDRALEGCSKVLNDKGILILELCSSYHNRLGRILKFRKTDAVERNFTILEARTILRNHGFGIIKEIYLFKEIPILVNSILNNLKLPESIINMSTWFYFMVHRVS